MSAKFQIGTNDDGTFKKAHACYINSASCPDHKDEIIVYKDN